NHASVHIAKVKAAAHTAQHQAPAHKRVHPGAALRAVQGEANPENYLNSATNSGLITDSQFNDGGFGDIGLQWNNVQTDGSVTAVHNSLSIQPENDGQGLITVSNISFPSDPAASPEPQTGTERELPPIPSLIDRDGDPVTTPLPPRTRPFDKTF